MILVKQNFERNYVVSVILVATVQATSPSLEHDRP